MELDPPVTRTIVELKSSQRSSRSPKSPQPPKRPSSSSIYVQIPCKHSRYVPGSGPPLQPIRLLPPHDSTAYIKDRILLPSAGRAANGKPLPKRMMYLVAWPDLPAATLLTPAMQVLDYVSPYALEKWEFNFEQEFDDEQIKLEKQKQAEEEEPAGTKKRKRERPPVHSEIEAAVVAEPETIAKAKSQPKKGVLSMLSPPRKRLRDFEGLFDDNEEDELSRDYDYDDNDYGDYGDRDETYSNDITPAEQMEQEARDDRQRRHEQDELGMAEDEYSNRIRPWPLMGTLNSGNASASNNRSTPVSFPSRLGSVATDSPRSIPNPSPTMDSTAAQQEEKRQQEQHQHQLYQQSQQNQQQLLQKLLQSQRQQQQQQLRQKHQSQQQRLNPPQNHQRMSQLPPLRYSTAASPRPSQKIELDVNKCSAMPTRPMVQPARPTQSTQSTGPAQTVQTVQSTQSTQPTGPAQPVLIPKPEPEPELGSKSAPSKPKLPSTSNEDNQWVVERLEDVRYYEDEDRGIVRYFLVRWEGDWPADQNPSWEPEEHIPTSLVKQFMRSYKAPQNKRPEAAAKQQKKKKPKKEMRQTTMLDWPSARKYSSVTEAFAGDEDSSSMGMRSSGARDSMEEEAERDGFFVVEEKRDEVKGEEAAKKGWNEAFGLRPWV